MSDLPTPRPELKGRRIAALLAALLALAATDAGAADCRDMGPRTTLKMPPPSMWVRPPADFARVSCEDMSENYAAMRGRPLDSMKRENRDCHLLGAWLYDAGPLANGVFYPNAGKIVVCAGLSPALEFMVRVHENAHRQFGWRDDGPGKSYTLAQWLKAAPARLVRAVVR